MPVEAMDESQATREQRRKTWFRVERSRNIDSKNSTILLQESQSGKEPTRSQWVKIFFLGYTLVGSVLFPNNLPWT